MARKPGTEVATAPENTSALPAFMQPRKQSSFGNISTTDMIIPRLKLLQGTSPELTAFNNARIGEFWHTISDEALGEQVRVVPIIMRKSIVLWAPRNDDRGILARSVDCIHWDQPDQKFEVVPKGKKTKVVYDLKGNVEESGLAKFGSSDPDDRNSKPAASLTYNFLFYLPDFPTISPVAVINTRSSLRAGKTLISKIQQREGEHYGMVFNMKSTDEEGDGGPYKGYAYEAAGYVQDEETYKGLQEMFERFVADTSWRVNEEDDSDSADDTGGSSKPQGDTTGRGGKF